MSDNAAQFNFYLNRQGVTGKQGAKGEKGFSPVISVEKDTLSEYILRITNESSYFLTTNLRESKEDRGGTYIRYDRDQGVMYSGDADRANKTQYGEVRFATAEELAAGDESTVITPADLEDATANMVTTNTSQDINGLKTFKSQTEFQSNLIVRPSGGTTTGPSRVALGVETNSNQPYIELYNTNNKNAEIGLYNDTTMYIQAPFDSDKVVINNYGGESAPTGNAKDVVIYGNLINKNNDIASQVLNQDNVTAGNNITIDKTSTGITINSTGGSGGTEDYTQLTNKPQINGIELTGNKNGNDLGLANKSEIEELGNELNQLANDVTNLDTNKQNKLTAGTNIIIEGDVISATGGGVTDAYTKAETDELLDAKQDVFEPVEPLQLKIVTNENIVGYTEADDTITTTTFCRFNGITGGAPEYQGYTGVSQRSNSTTLDACISIPINGDNNIVKIPTVDRDNLSLGYYNEDGIYIPVIANIDTTNSSYPFNAQYVYQGDFREIQVQLSGSYYDIRRMSNGVDSLYIKSSNGAAGYSNSPEYASALGQCTYLQFNKDQDTGLLKCFQFWSVKGDYCYWGTADERLNTGMREQLNKITHVVIGGASFHNSVTYNKSDFGVYEADGRVYWDMPGLISALDGKPNILNLFSNSTTRSLVINTTDNLQVTNGELDVGATVTTQGNTFNGANQLVQLDSSGKLPAIDGSQLTNLPSYTKIETDNLLDTKVNTSDMFELPVVEVPVVIEQSDKSLMPSWYRVWSNGWIEQGGQISVTNTTTVNLLKPYTQTNYLPNTQAIGQSTSNQANTFVSPIDTNSFSITSSTSTAQDFNWYCVGY